MEQHSQTPDLPAGLRALYGACFSLYPDQPNPLQVAAVKKYWLQGPDPLDYISMYSSPGCPQAGVPPHWHYISFGLSDLHGDGRVFEPASAVGSPSGHGFELTFRLAREGGAGDPPVWPATVMQALAKYVFQTETPIRSGDHFRWHIPLDSSESRIQHLLMCDDPQLGLVDTPNGPVTFVQIVGVTSEELEAAQHWNGPGVASLLRSVKGAGGAWLVTDMRRTDSVFQMRPDAREFVDAAIAAEGSNLTGVSVCCTWKELDEGDLERGFANISIKESEQIKATLQKGLLGAEAASPASCKQGTELCQTQTEPRFIDKVHIRLDMDSQPVFTTALRGRLKHNRPFTLRSVTCNLSVTLVTPGQVGLPFVTQERPFGAYGPWLQVMLAEAEVEAMLRDVAMDLDVPKTFLWCGGNLAVTFTHKASFVVKDDQVLQGS